MLKCHHCSGCIALDCKLKAVKGASSHPDDDKWPPIAANLLVSLLRVHVLLLKHSCPPPWGHDYDGAHVIGADPMWIGMQIGDMSRRRPHSHATLTQAENLERAQPGRQ